MYISAQVLQDLVKASVVAIVQTSHTESFVFYLEIFTLQLRLDCYAFWLCFERALIFPNQR